MTRRPTRPRAYAPDPDAPGQLCEMPGCTALGAYRAPKSRTHLHEYFWFCLDHVRAYNAAWDFYKGMSPGQIEAQLRADTAWQRPTWPLGNLGGGSASAMRAEADLLDRDPLHIFERGQARRRSPDAAPPSELRESLATLGLDWPLTMDALKHRYKELAKRHHPDANGGDRRAEERLKTINLAYAAVRLHLTELPRAATG